jgi:hypothetical protein
VLALAANFLRFVCFKLLLGVYGSVPFPSHADMGIDIL